LATLERLLSLLSAFEVVWMTDGWPLYEYRLKESCTLCSKLIYERIERHNLNLRQHLKAGLILTRHFRTAFVS
jgi:insertion element IS1 protein InsB